MDTSFFEKASVSISSPLVRKSTDSLILSNPGIFSINASKVVIKMAPFFSDRVFTQFILSLVSSFPFKSD